MADDQILSKVVKGSGGGATSLLRPRRRSMAAAWVEGEDGWHAGRLRYAI